MMTAPTYRTGRRTEPRPPNVRPLTERVLLMLRAYHTGLTVEKLSALLHEDRVPIHVALQQLSETGRIVEVEHWPGVWVCLASDLVDEP